MASTLHLETSITTDQPVLGEVIDVTIEAQACEDIEARIVARLECVADGQTTDVWEIERLRLFEGPIAFGKRTFEVSFELPRLAPLSTRAGLFYVEWRVVVEADAWSSKIEKVVQDVAFRPQAPTSMMVLDDPHIGELAPREDLSDKRQLLVLLFVLTPIPALMIGGLTHPILGIAFIIIMGFLFAPMASPVVRRELATRRVSGVTLEIDPFEPRIGDVFVVGLHFEPASKAKVTAVWLTLMGRERAIRISNGGRVATERQVFQESRELEFDDVHEDGGPVALSTSFRIPEQAIPTIAFEHNKVEWTVGVRIELEGWADYEEEQVIRVHRARRLEAEAGSPVARKEG